MYGHFGPKTFQHYVFGAEVSHIFALVLDTWHQCRTVSDSSALKCMRHFGPKIKICFECVKNIEPLYIYSNGLKVLGKRLTKVVSSLLHVSRSRIVGNEHNRSRGRGMQQKRMVSFSILPNRLSLMRNSLYYTYPHQSLRCDRKRSFVESNRYLLARNDS